MKLARQRRQFTAKALAEKVFVNAVTISRLEKGTHQPDPGTLTSLSRALQFPESFFLEKEMDLLDQETASFRSRKAMTAKERDAALASGALGFIISDWISERFNLPVTDLPNWGSEADPAATARMLRDLWCLGEKPIKDMTRLLEAKGIVLFSLSEATRRVDAFSCWRNGKAYIFLNMQKTAERSRFDCAHELGHLILHRHGGPSNREAEREADNFASSFLMPSADVESRVHRVSSVATILKAKKRWGVSAMAMAYRLHKLGRLSNWQYRTFCIQLSQLGYGTGEPDGIAREESSVWPQVLQELWKEGVTRQHIAQAVHIPFEEFENLVNGLLSGDMALGMGEASQGLRLV